MSDELAEARATNTRLNRRLGDMEGSLFELVSRAQRQTNDALLRAEQAQRDHASANSRMAAVLKDRSEEFHLTVALFFALVVVTLWSIGATIWTILK